MRQRGRLLSALFVLCFPFILQAFSLPPHTLDTLSKARYWHVLLHFKNGKSEIDDSSFFLSSKGHVNPKSELDATIREIQEHNKTILCKYPARVFWLKSKIPELFAHDEKSTCDKIEHILKDYPARHMTLVFPTAHINSPASMFGHTFLRADEDRATPLISQAINYAAQSDESNGLMFAYNGLLGGYKGYYSVLPYYKKIKEYNHMEQRDMWEYGLNLNALEIRKLLYHLYELKGVYSDYYFFTKNCSYNLLWLLQSARSDVALTSGFVYKAIPVDTIRAVKSAGLIEDVHFRPSQRKEMQAIVKKIKDIKKTNHFITTYDISLLKDLNKTQKIYTLDLAVRILKYERSRHRHTKQKYVNTLMQLLKTRSELPKIPPYTVTAPTDPLLGHKSARVEIFTTSRKDFGFSIKPAFHDIYDIEDGFIQGAYIDFFNLQIKKSKQENLRIDKLDFVSITSLAKRDSFFKPYSWSVGFGLQRVHDDKLYFGVDFGGGLTYGGKNTLVYLMLRPKVLIGKNTMVSISPEIGFVTNFKRTKVGAYFDKTYFSDGIIQHKAEVFTTYKLSRDIALNLKLQQDKILHSSGTLSLSLFYYF